jgi:DNA mismatch repair protein MutS2
MERKLKQLVFDWRKAEKEEDRKLLMKNMQALLFTQKDKQVKEKVKKKLDSKYMEVDQDPAVGDLVLMKQNNKVGTLSEVRGKKAIVNLGAMPLQVNYADLITVKEKEV